MNPTPDDSVDDALVSEHRGLSLIWLLPLLAALVGGWLVWRDLADAGITATVMFEDGAGITPGKTEVRYEGIAIGNVAEMELQEDLSGVVVTLEFDPSAEPLLREDTDIWLVKPQVSLAGVTGLETLVSGNYITLRPGDGPAATRFEALSEPPASSGAEGALQLTLQADDLGTLSSGAPVSYQKVEVGTVRGYQLRPEGDGVDINVSIRPQYRHLVNRSSRFWNASGIELRGGLRGFEVETGSLMSILRGGILFDTPDLDAAAVDNGARLPLHADHQAASAGVDITLVVPEPEGIQAGQTEIRYQGFRLGRIRSLELNPDDPRKGAIAKARISPQAESYLTENAHFWVVRPRLSAEGVSGLDALLGGPYIELAPGNDGEPQRRYTLLEQPPPLGDDAPGLQLWLRTESLGSLARGAAVYYRRVKVGSVQDFALRPEGDAIDVRVHIEPEYEHLVTERSRFWNASGFDISGGLDGIHVRAESLAAILAGGIAFSTPGGGTGAEDGHRFRLYANREDAEERGVYIEIFLPAGDGLKVGSPIKYQGIEVGAITDLRLAEDLGGVVAEVRLDQQSQAIAREGSRFWVVKPQLGLLETRHLDTLISGSYLAVAPGHGGPALRFAGLAQAPLEEAESGLPLILEAPRLGSIRRGHKVYYRDIAVGVVADQRLGDPADHVEIELRIQPRYTALVRRDTRFFSMSGLQIDAGLFSGLQVDTASLETLIAGGIGLATPEQDAGPPAAPHSRFQLHPEAQPEWLQWRPGLRLEPTGPAPSP